MSSMLNKLVTRASLADYKKILIVLFFGLYPKISMSATDHFFPTCEVVLKTQSQLLSESSDVRFQNSKELDNVSAQLKAWPQSKVGRFAKWAISKLDPSQASSRRVLLEKEEALKERIRINNGQRLLVQKLGEVEQRLKAYQKRPEFVKGIKVYPMAGFYFRIVETVWLRNIQNELGKEILDRKLLEKISLRLHLIEAKFDAVIVGFSPRSALLFQDMIAELRDYISSALYVSGKDVFYQRSVRVRQTLAQIAFQHERNPDDVLNIFREELARAKRKDEALLQTNARIESGMALSGNLVVDKMSMERLLFKAVPRMRTHLVFRALERTAISRNKRFREAIPNTESLLALTDIILNYQFYTHQYRDEGDGTLLSRSSPFDSFFDVDFFADRLLSRLSSVYQILRGFDPKWANQTTAALLLGLREPMVSPTEQFLNEAQMIKNLGSEIRRLTGRSLLPEQVARLAVVADREKISRGLIAQYLKKIDHISGHSATFPNVLFMIQRLGSLQRSLPAMMSFEVTTEVLATIVLNPRNWRSHVSDSLMDSDSFAIKQDHYEIEDYPISIRERPKHIEQFLNAKD